MKITDILARKKFLFSCEFYPPKTEEGLVQLLETVREIKTLGPGYVSVTYGAGGSTREKTLDIVRRVKHEVGIESMAHLTCVGHSRNELGRILDELKAAGIENVIALRGDPPKGQNGFVPHADGFAYASELTAFIRGSWPFCIAVAGYPEGHVEAPDKETDWERLKAKVGAGADFIVTQLFFDNSDFFAFEKKMREKGVSVPIIPGLMPITNYAQILRFTGMCGAKMPETMMRDLEPIKEDAEAVQNYGVEYATRQCMELIDRGAPGIHFYTLNKSRSTKRIVENLSEKLKGKNQ